MTILTDDTLERMQAAVRATLPSTAVLSSRTYTSDAGGGGTTSWTAYGTVECRLSPVRPASFGREVDVASRLAEQEPFLITFPAGTSVDPESRVATHGKTYEVLAVHQPRSWELSCRVEVMESAV